MRKLAKKRKLLLLFTCLLMTSCKPSITQSSSVDSNILVDDDGVGYKKEFISTSIRELNYSKIALPSLAVEKQNPKILVVPIDFSDCTAEEKEYSIEDIKEVFTGNGDSTKRSVQSFYRNSSYGKCELDIDVYPTWYRAKNPASLYTRMVGDNYDAVPAVTSIITDFLLDNDATMDFSKYDSDKDGYIDALYFIYSFDVDYMDEVNRDLWWAFRYQYRKSEPLYVDGVQPFGYVWAGYQFMLEKKQTHNINTYIHELGHLFGLDDYYDYDPKNGANNGGLGTKDLMDNTIGDHNPFSKMLLGWANQPYVITTKKELQIDLKAFQRNGDFIILSNSWNQNLGMYQEYFILEYYTPDYMQEHDKIFTVSGIRLLHVNAKKTGNNSYSRLLYDNSYTKYKLISMICFDTGETLLNNGVADDSHLFTEGDYLKKVYYDDNTLLKYTFKVNGLYEDYASLTITYNNK